MNERITKTYEDYLKTNTISQINILEKKDIIQFLLLTYQDNLNASIFNKENFPRWAVISGYYAMHDISKLYLAKKYDLKFTKPSVHDAVIKALKKLVDKKEIILLIDKADLEFSKIQKLDYFLSKGKAHREKTQYYTQLSYSKEQTVKIAEEFIENIVKPYIKIVEKLIEKEEK